MKSSKRIFAWHHWCGLIVGFFLLVMSTSGAILVFSEEIEEVADHAWAKVDNPAGTFAYDASFKAVREKYPEWEIRIYPQHGPNRAIIYDLRKKEQRKKIFAHPLNGQILHISDNAHKAFERQVLLLHYTWFAGTPGKVFVFLIGVLFLVSLVTGLYVYRKAIIKTFSFKVRINRRTARSFHSSLHRVVGVWSLAFNLLIVATGLALSGKIALTALKGTKASAAEQENTVVSIDKNKNFIDKNFSQFEIHLIRSRPGSSSVQFSGRYLDDPFYYGNYNSNFTLNGATQEVEKKQVLRQLPLGERLLAFSSPLHFGAYGGIWTKVLYCLLGLTPGLLSITGFVLWRRKAKSHPKPLKGNFSAARESAISSKIF
ncbi:PepSY domain-containing protein [Chitinophagaceae bacterium LB-8]|uniref:PepSY domain-containing protein n=1 Tax=Paraflavisolibacter caeni TaxID=2982496 RepID=A0A9X2XYM9_9BACT|nr:PepSY-associated TM helix domain-containing protein [Paraflavisolibacter caeni]MCU7551801.1 PepSY domain-containing protein [Paraflavisolibacter caeni]